MVTEDVDVFAVMYAIVVDRNREQFAALAHRVVKDGTKTIIKYSGQDLFLVPATAEMRAVLEALIYFFCDYDEAIEDSISFQSICFLLDYNISAARKAIWERDVSEDHKKQFRQLAAERGYKLCI